MLRDLNRIWKHHPLYFLCSIIYFYLGGRFLGGTIGSFIIAFVLYMVSIMIAISPAGEKVFRFMYGIRKLETNEEKEYLKPIFRDVIDSIYNYKKSKFGGYGLIEICVIDKMDVNACAVGKRTIAVTKGAIKAFDEEQLKGVIAHEVGHLAACDTIANLFLVVGSGYCYLYVLLANLVLLLIDKIAGITNDKKTGRLIYSIFRWICKTIIFIFSFLTQVTLAIESRRREYAADHTAYRLGYGEGLISALYLLEKINLGDNSTITQKITASHPRVTARIGELEYYVSEGKESI